jgi:glycosyltransferase involved in cell wall biosynthesis
MVQKKIIFDYTIPGLYNAGIRYWSEDLLKVLKESKLFDIIIITPYPNEELKKYGNVVLVPYFSYRIPLLHRFAYYNLKFSRAMKVFTGTPIFSPYFQLPRKILKKHDCIITIHDTLYYDLSNFYKRFDLLLLKNITNYYHSFNVKWSKEIITVSQFSRDRLSRLFGINCLEIVYNVPVIPKKDDVDNQSYFVYFGGWETRKRAELAMKLANIILNKDENIYFVVSGVSSVNQIKSYFTNDVLSRIIFKDRFSKEKMSYYWGKSRFSIYTSAFEGFGIPILESQLYGLPVIVFSDLVISPEIPLNGVLKIDIDSNFSLAIDKIILEMIDIDSNSISNAARQVVQKLEIHNLKIPQLLYDIL